MRKITFDPELIAELWNSTMTVGQIARKLGCGEEVLRRQAKRQGLPRRKTGMRGIGHVFWKGGRTVDKDGYILVNTGPRKRVREHRLVMESHLGRLLLRSEVVHHVNGNKQDNRIENLALYATNSDHLRETLKGQVPQWTPEGREKMLRGAALWQKQQKSIRDAKGKGAQK